MKFSEKQKIILVIAVFGLLIGGLVALNVLKFRQRSEILAKIEGLKEEEEKANDKIKRIPELREKRANLANIIDQYVEILPKEDSIQHDAFVEIIDSYRKDTQIVIQRTEYIKPKNETDDGKKKQKENFTRHRYRFKMTGTVPDFVRFINKVENHTRFLKIDSMTIKPMGTADEVNEFDDRTDAEEINKARIPFKDIEVTVSTYTYSKGEGDKR